VTLRHVAGGRLARPEAINYRKGEQEMNNCPCGSGAAYADCCEPIITGVRPAATAEQLMRARYSAYVNVAMDFLFESNHPDHREGYDPKGTREWAESSDWEGLEIVGLEQGGPGDTTGTVEFIARFREKDVPHAHHELAQFKKFEENWYFTEGALVKQKPLVSQKIGRNDPCTCGSGAKYKKCCGK
jgi:SEC-C motif domain protein